MRTESEFRALLVLLADDSERVASVAWETLLGEREHAVPYLEEGARSADPRLRGRARLLLDEIHLVNLEDRWRTYTDLPGDDMDLEQGCLLLSELAGPVDARAVSSFLDATAGLVRAHMASTGGLQALGEVLFDNLGFRGGDFELPENHYLLSVLERRAGVPILLGTVYELVGRRAGLPVSGVAWPGRYLARFERPDGPFFIDCFNRGRLIPLESLLGLLTSQGHSNPERYLMPCGHRFTLYRMLNNLETVYSQADDTRLSEAVRRLRSHLGIASEE